MALDKPYKNVPGTIIFDAEMARKGYHLNQFSMSLMKPENRERYLADREAYLDEWPLSDKQRQAVLDLDLNAMMAEGGNIYFLSKIGATHGLSFQQMAGSMTGMSEAAYRDMMIGGGRRPEGNRLKDLDGWVPPEPGEKAETMRPDAPARFTSALYTSHVPAIGAAMDLGKTEEPYWKKVFSGYEWTRKWAKENTPDVVILDLPPLLDDAVMMALMPQLDAVLLVADGLNSTARDILECERILEGQLPLLGIVLNKSCQRFVGDFEIGNQSSQFVQWRCLYKFHWPSPRNADVQRDLIARVDGCWRGMRHYTITPHCASVVIRPPCQRNRNDLSGAYADIAYDRT